MVPPGMQSDARVSLVGSVSCQKVVCGQTGFVVPALRLQSVVNVCGSIDYGRPRRRWCWFSCGDPVLGLWRVGGLRAELACRGSFRTCWFPCAVLLGTCIGTRAPQPGTTELRAASTGLSGAAGISQRSPSTLALEPSKDTLPCSQPTRNGNQGLPRPAPYLRLCA